MRRPVTIYRLKHKPTPAQTARGRFFSYRLTVEQIATMVAAQNGNCKICALPFPFGKFHVDHCHVTNFVRGLLCHKCNVGLGMFKDNPENLSRAITYLSRSSFPEKSVD